MSVDTGPGEHAAAAAPTCMDQLSGSRAAAGAQRIVRPCTRAVARADERKRQGGDRRVELHTFQRGSKLFPEINGDQVVSISLS